MRPNRDIENAFAAAQANNLYHRLSHALRASACNSSGSSRTLAPANDDKNSAVSSDQRPPSTINRALPPSPASSGFVRSFRPGLFQSLAVLLSGPSPGPPVVVEWGHHSGVCDKLDTRMKTITDCVSGTSGIRSNRTRCSAILPSKNRCTKSGCHREMLRTLNPC